MGQAAANDTLELREIATAPLPPTFGVLGGAIASDGTVLLWDATSLLSHSLESGITRVCINLTLAPRYAAPSKAAGHFEVFDSLRQRIIDLPARARCVPRTIETVRHADEVVWHGGEGWVAARFTGSDRASFNVLQAGMRVRGLTLPPDLPMRFGTAADYVPAASASASFITETAYPFRTLQFRVGDGVVIASEPTYELEVAARREILSGWRSLRLLALDGAFLQVLVDPRSDRRRVLLLDGRGKLVRDREINVAIGFLDSHVPTRTLLAVRNVGMSWFSGNVTRV